MQVKKLTKQSLDKELSYLVSYSKFAFDKDESLKHKFWIKTQWKNGHVRLEKHQPVHYEWPNSMLKYEY